MRLLRIDSSARTASVTRQLTARAAEEWKENYPDWSGTVPYPTRATFSDSSGLRTYRSSMLRTKAGSKPLRPSTPPWKESLDSLVIRACKRSLIKARNKL